MRKLLMVSSYTSPLRGGEDMSVNIDDKQIIKNLSREIAKEENYYLQKTGLKRDETYLQNPKKWDNFANKTRDSKNFQDKQKILKKEYSKEHKKANDSRLPPNNETKARSNPSIGVNAYYNNMGSKLYEENYNKIKW